MEINLTTILYSLYIGLTILFIALFFTFLTMCLLIYAIKYLSLGSNNGEGNFDSNTTVEKNSSSEDVMNSNIIIASAIAAYLENENYHKNENTVKMSSDSINNTWELIGKYNQFVNHLKKDLTFKKQ